MLVLLVMMLLGLVRGASRCCIGSRRSGRSRSRCRSLCECASGEQSDKRRGNELLFHGSEILEVDVDYAATTSRVPV